MCLAAYHARNEAGCSARWSWSCNARLRNASLGNFGDTRHVGDGISEMRVHYGPEYRLYFMRAPAQADWIAAGDSGIDQPEQPTIKVGAAVVVLLCAGDKDTQERDIQRAKRLAQDWR